MNEENNSGTRLKIIGSEVELGERRIAGRSNFTKKINPVTMTDITQNEGNILESEVSILRKDNQSASNLESPMGSFLSLNSEQSSEREEDYSITSMTNWVKILKFEDTLAEESHRQFEIIYESLLLESKVGNLTKLTLEVVLAQKPPAWLQVIHERLKHLIISSEMFQNRWKREYRVKRKMKFDEKDKIVEDKGQRGWQIRNSSSQWPKDKSTKNSIIGILNNWFCW